MTAFAGVVRFDGAPLGADDAPAGDVLVEAAGVRLVGDAAALAREGDVALLADARVVAAEPPDARTPLDAAALLARYLADGPAFVDGLRGRFALAVVHLGERRVTLVRDHVGAAGLFHAPFAGGVVFGTRIRDLQASARVGRRLDREQLAVFFHGLAQYDERRTVWDGVRRVPARGRVTWADGRAEEHAWLDWSHVRPERGVAVEEWLARYRDTFRRAVRRGHEDGERVGSLLSGGLDSSSIVVELAGGPGAGAAPLDVVTARFPRSPASDEGRFSAAVVATGGIRQHEVDVDALAPFGPAVLAHVAGRDEPSYGANLFVNLAVTRVAAEQGVEALYDGVDGDSVLGYGLERLTTLALRGRWIALVRELRSAAPRLGRTPGGLFRDQVLGTLRARVLDLLPDGPRLARRRGKGLDLFRADLVASTDLADRVARLGLQPTDVSCRQSLLAGLGCSFHGAILEFLSTVLAENGVRGAFPYFDRDLIALSLALPDDLRLRDGWTRWIQRAASERLPDEVRWRPWKHLLQRGFADALLAHHGDLLGRLDDPTLPAFELLDQRRVVRIRDRLLDRARPDDAFLSGKVLALSCWLDPDSLS